MTPLKTFQKTIIFFKQKPFQFWPLEVQKSLVEDLVGSLVKLKSSLEKNKLEDTNAYKILAHLQKDVLSLEKNEVLFIQHLSNLIEVYLLSPTDEEMSEFLRELGSLVAVTKIKLLEHHTALENLQKKAKKLSEEEKNKKDLETIQKIGIFYVLEYTLQVLWEFGHLKDEDKNKLLEVGLKTKAGNLPAFLPLEETFKKELSYELFDDNLRNNLFSAFYKWEEELYNQKRDYKALNLALKQFNLELLQAFEAKGYKTFKVTIYVPFGNNVPTQNIINSLKNF